MSADTPTLDAAARRETPTEYQRHAMRVPCFTCGAGVGEPCVTTLAVVPENAARVHINRVIAADHTFPYEVPNGR